MFAYRILFLITLPIILTVSFLTAGIHSVYANESGDMVEVSEVCILNIDKDLQGTLDKNNATVTNYSKNPECSYEATLALYSVLQEPESPRWIDTQKFSNSKTVNVKPGETVKFTVDPVDSSCTIQADLFRGSNVLETPFYSNAMDVKVYTIEGCGIIQSVKTSTSDSAGAAASQTGSVQGAKSESSFAGTGNNILIFAIIIAAAVSLIFGMILKRISK